MGLGNFVDQSGVTRLRASGGGGGSMPITREEWNGYVNDVADGGGDWVSWTTSGGPDSLIDTTNPAHPTIITTGVYLVSIAIGPGSMSNNGYFVAGLHLDRDGFNASMYAKSSRAALAPATGDVSDVTLAFAWYIPAGNQIGVFVENHDGSGVAVDFIMGYAHIQRLS